MTTPLDIKARIDALSYIGQHVQLRPAGKIHKGLCPFHDEKTPSFVVYPETGTWHCFGSCATGGDIFEFRMRVEQISFRTALDAWCDELHLPRPGDPQKKRLRQDHLLGIVAEATAQYQQLLRESPAAQQARDYLASRQIGASEQAYWQIGYAPQSWTFMTTHLLKLGYSKADILAAGVGAEKDGHVYDRFRNRILFPIHDDRGQIVGFAARQIDPADEPKYLNSPQSEIFNKSHLLYGLHRAKDRIRKDRAVVLMEGYTDVIAAHRHGYTNVVAQMGTALTKEQVKLLGNAGIIPFVGRITIALDGDEAGQKATRQDIEHLIKISSNIHIAELPDGKDPDELMQSGIWPQVVSESLPAVDWLLSYEVDRLPEGASLNERVALANRVLPTLARLDDVTCMTYVQTLGMMLKLDPIALRTKGLNILYQPDLRVLDKPQKTVEVDPIEQAVIAILLHAPQRYYAMQRLMRECELRILDAYDFPQFRQLYVLLEAGLEQIAVEPLEYVLQHTDEVPEAQDPGLCTDGDLIRMILRLRAARIQREFAAYQSFGIYNAPELQVSNREHGRIHHSLRQKFQSMR